MTQNTSSNASQIGDVDEGSKVSMAQSVRQGPENLFMGAAAMPRGEGHFQRVQMRSQQVKGFPKNHHGVAPEPTSSQNFMNEVLSPVCNEDLQSFEAVSEMMRQEEGMAQSYEIHQMQNHQHLIGLRNQSFQLAHPELKNKPEINEISRILAQSRRTAEPIHERLYKQDILSKKIAQEVENRNGVQKPPPRRVRSRQTASR